MQLKPLLGDRGGMFLFMGLMIVGIFLMPLTANPVVLAIGAALNGAGGGVASPYFTAMLIERAPIAARGRAIGLLFTMQYVGSFANPFVVAPLVGLLGRHNAFFGVSALLAVGLAAALFRRPSRNS